MESSSFPRQDSHPPKNTEPSNSLSSHLHSTTRRIFIGPTPTNWSYKKKSFFFSKSNHAKAHQNVKNKLTTKQKRTGLILTNGTIKKREKQKDFVARRDSIGPSNLTSLDYDEIISRSQGQRYFRERKKNAF